MKNTGYTKGEWHIDPYSGIITAVQQKRHLGYIQDFCQTIEHRREHTANVRLIGLANQIYEAMVELYQSNQNTHDTDRNFEAMRQVEILIERMSAPIVVPGRTPPARKKP